MFTDQAELDGTQRLKKADGKIPKAEDSTTTKATDALDSEKMVALHSRLMSNYVRELRRQEINRWEQAKDEDAYDNHMWSEEDKATLKERGQMPLVYNIMATVIKWITGTEKRARTQFKVLPRRKEDGKAAQRKTELLKYLDDVNSESFSKSRAFKDAVVVGVGWLEEGVQDEDDGEPVYVRTESWRNILWDSAGVEPDMSDRRYVTRTKWVDLDIAMAMFPKRADMVRESALEVDRMLHDLQFGDVAMDTIEVQNDSYRAEREDNAYRRDRVRIIEMWFRMPVEVPRLKGGDFHGEMFIEGHPGHERSIEGGEAVIVSKVMMRMHVAIMTPKGLLHVSMSPYRHNNFPFTPIWANIRGRTGLPYGVARGLRDINDDINKRASKALHILNTSKTIMDEGAVDDLDAFKDEVARPDAIIVKKPGKELTLNADRGLEASHLQIFSSAISLMYSISGVTEANMGKSTGQQSGVALQTMQNSGSLATADLFDNLRFAFQKSGEKQLSLVEQYFTETKDFRITNMRGTPEYIKINDGLPENAISHTKADFIISEADWQMTMRQSATDELVALLKELAPVAPQLVATMIDLIVENMDIPNRDELVKRIRAVTGMRDPDAEGPTPQEQQQAQKKAEAEQLQTDLMKAKLADLQAGAQAKGAMAAKTGADAKRIIAAIAGLNVETQAAALEAALVMIQSPPAVPVADGVLHEAGFVSRSEQEDDQQRNQAMQAEQAKQQAAAQQQAQQQAAQQQAAAKQQAAVQADAARNAAAKRIRPNPDAQQETVEQEGVEQVQEPQQEQEE